jgi:hypothetical protein
MAIAKSAAIVAGLAFTLGVAGPAVAQDFFSFFNFGQPQEGMSYAADSPYDYTPRRRAPRVSRSNPDSSTNSASSGGGSGQAYCVRTCDGRYFPLTVSENSAAACASFCPGTETKVFKGSTIDNARSEKGQNYSALPNAFRFRKELVAACTCNGKTTGLAPVRLEDDPTLKRGDLVASEQGLMVSAGSDKRGAQLKLTPAAPDVAAKYQRAAAIEE